MTKIYTVKDLIDYLSKLDPSMELVTQRYSDYRYMILEDEKGTGRYGFYTNEADIQIVKALPPKNEDGAGYWITRYHETMSEEQKAKCKDFLYFVGN